MKKYVHFISLPLSVMFISPANSSITIDFLKNHPEHVVTCATWTYHQWGHHVPDTTLNMFIESRKEYLNDDILPLTVIALEDDVPVGMCSLASTRGILPELTPWLASLYVVSEYRNRGIGSLLEQAICTKALAMGYSKIYLFTSYPEVIPWYEKLHWHVRKTAWQRDHNVTVMEKDL